MPTMKPARARSAFFGVRPSSTFWRPLREHTMPSAAHAIETIADRPNPTTSRAARDRDDRRKAEAQKEQGGRQDGEHEAGHCVAVARHVGRGLLPAGGL